jgi:hypothetical protein
MRSHATGAPLGHARAEARGECLRRSAQSLELLVLDLALTCLEGAALGRAVMVLQEAADDSEAAAADALAKASRLGAGAAASKAAIEAAASLARIERAEVAAAGRWAAHLAQSRELARRALAVATDRSRAVSPARVRRFDSSA